MIFEVSSNPNHFVMSFLPFVVWTQDKSLIYHQNYVGMIKQCQQHCPFLSSFLSSDSCFPILYASALLESAEDTLILDIIMANSLFDSFVSGPLYTLANCINNNSFYLATSLQTFLLLQYLDIFLLTSVIIHTHGKCFYPSGFRVFFFFFFPSFGYGFCQHLWYLTAPDVPFNLWCCLIWEKRSSIRLVF